MTDLIHATGLAKSYGPKQALKPANFSVPAGQILGVIGANGAGKSTLLNTLLGLISYEGSLSVLGHNPYLDRARLMKEVCFIADVATLPRWLTVRQLLELTAGLHPGFDMAAAMQRLAKTSVRLDSQIKTLSKGMVVQVHLAIVLAIKARLLVLDEPTLGLDILNRRAFYDAILTDYFDEERTIIVTTHQVEEIEQILTHAMMVKEGTIVVYDSLDTLSERYLAVDVEEGQRMSAQALNPMMSRSIMGRVSYLYDGVPRSTLEQFGTPRRIGLSDLFVALNQGDNK